MNKKELSEQEIRTRYITPAITASGWRLAQLREEYTFTAALLDVPFIYTSDGDCFFEHDRTAAWEAAMIYPHNNNPGCVLSERQRQQLVLFT